ncbi:MAG: hypothetical protein IKH04_10830 [Kiritimatiellae bacterium]|nr:hypothetical protein [Kiritimatiellia bacterium]
MRELSLLDPHTWASSVPTEIIDKLCGELERVSDCLSAFGQQRWIRALADETIRLPKFKNQAAFTAFLAEDMDDDRIVLLAITYTRIQVAFYLRDRAGDLMSTVRGRNPVEELQSIAMSAVKTLFRWQWIVPFDDEGRFDFNKWKYPDNGYY